MNEQLIAGAGGKKKKPRRPVEAKDTLQSRAMVSLLDLLGEGQIGGLVNGAKSIFFDDTPLESDNGTANFPGVTWEARDGQQLQDPIPGFASVETPRNISVQAKVSNPVTVTITNPNADRVRAIVGVTGLWQQNIDNGDTNGTTVSYRFWISVNGGSFTLLGDHTLTGKTRSAHHRSHTYDLPKTDGSGAPATSWTLKMERLTPDSTTQTLANDTYLDTIVEIVDSQLTYPNSALVGITIDSELFNQVPTRSYHVRGLYIQVPSNYDAATRAYSGVWDGTLKVAVSNNPAWILYDLLTNKRYGLGQFIAPSQIDKAKLYQIGRYCDELVGDGFGGWEPRFTINTVIQTQAEAYKLIADICAVFRGMAFWSGSAVGFTQDAPTDPSMVYSAANVVGGNFTYTGSAKRDRYSVALVTWNDPASGYKRMVEYVEDQELVAKIGVRKLDTVAFGCVSRAQANRVGRWILYTQRYAEMVTFKVGIDSMMVLPGEVIKIHDQWRAGARFSGRLMDSTLTSATLDAPVELAQGAMIALMLPNGQMEERPVLEGAGTFSVLTWVEPLSDVPVPNGLWSLSDPTLEPMLARVVGVAHDSSTEFTITALEHHPEKYASVEQGLALEPMQTSKIKSRPGVVTNIVTKTELYNQNSDTLSTRIAVSWTAPASATTYAIWWARDNENQQYAESTSPSFDINNVAAGTFKISIAAVNAIGGAGETVTVTHVVDKSATSPDVQNLRLNPNFEGSDLPLMWDAVAGATQYVIEFREPDTNALVRTEQTTVTEYVYTYSRNVADGGPRRSLKVGVKAKTLVGESANWTTATFSNPAPATPMGILTEAGPGQVSIMAERPSDEDLAGMLVWMGTESDFPTIDGTLIYKGTDNAYMKTGLQPGIAVYFKVAFYDHFGTAGLNVSTSVMAIPTATGGVMVVTELPLSPDDIAGELAVFLDVPDPDQRGLYGWSGSEWTSTSKILDGSVTGDKLAYGAVDFTKLAAGAVQARNLAIRKHFLY